MKTIQMEPVELGSMNGQPMIVWQRVGIAAVGEPAIVKEVRVYGNDQARQHAFLWEMNYLFSADSILKGVCY